MSDITCPNCGYAPALSVVQRLHFDDPTLPMHAKVKIMFEYRCQCGAKLHRQERWVAPKDAPTEWVQVS